MPPRRKTGKRAPAKRRSKSQSQSRSAYLILGEDDYLRDRHREELVAKFLAPADREFGLNRIDLGRDSLAEALGRAATPGLFAARQVLVFSRVEKMREQDVAALEDYFDAPAEHTVLIFEAAKLDKRTRSAKLLLGCCELREAGSPAEDADALQVVGSFAGELGLQFSRDAAEDLVMAVGHNLGRLRREMEKLQAYVGKAGKVTAADVAAVVTHAREFNVFEMAHFLAERRQDQALLRLRRMLEMGVEPVGVIGALAWVFRQMLRARALPPGTPSWQAAKTLRMYGPRAEAMVRQAHNFSGESLRRALGLLYETDIALKSTPPDAHAILEALVVDLGGL